MNIVPQTTSRLKTHLGRAQIILERHAGSLRTQLIFWNVVAIFLLLGGLGVVCHFITLSFMDRSINEELKRGTAMYHRSPRVASALALRGSGHPGEPPHSGHRPVPGNAGFDDNREPPPGPPPFYHSNFPFAASPSDHGPFDRGGFEHGGHGSPPNFSGRPHSPPRFPEADNRYHSRFFFAVGQPEMPGDRLPIWDAAALKRALKGASLYTTVTDDGEAVRVYSAPGFGHDGRKGAVQIAYPLKEVDRAIAGIDTALLLLIPVGLIGAGWMGLALTKRVLKPVDRMTQAAGRLGAENLTRRLPVSGSDEFAALATTFNGLLGRLEQAFQAQKQLLMLQQRFTADASHELKTPLTIIKGRTSLALGRASTDEKLRHTFREIDEAANTMSQLVQDLLLLARSDEGQMGRNPLQLHVGEVLEMAVAQALKKDSAPIALHVESEALCVTGNEEELVRVFRNLLDNAVCYTPAGGYINVIARAMQNAIVVTVEDTGTGIAAEHLPHLGERFYRVDTSRTRPTGGTGLGLSICKSIVEAHGGTLAFSSTQGVGTTVTVHLPN